MTRRVFLSYARVDRSIVEALAEDLRNWECEPFFDEQLTGGKAWWDQLLGQIEECQAFLPVLSTHYLGSHPCRLEAGHAEALGKPFLPIAIEAVASTLCMPCIAETQWISYNTTDRTALRELLRGVQNLPECPDLPASMPPRPEIPISYMTHLTEQIESSDDLTHKDQVLLLDSLKARIGGPDDLAARSLLSALQQRRDLTVSVANDIAVLLGTDATHRGAPTDSWSPPRPPGPQRVPPPLPTPPPTAPTSQGQPWSTGAFVGLIIASMLCGGLVGIIVGAIERKNPAKKSQAKALLWIGIGILALAIVFGIIGALASPQPAQCDPTVSVCP